MKISIFSLLGIVFIVLKLTGVIAWSWVWVLAPFWIPMAIAFTFLGVILAIPSTRKAFMTGAKGRLQARLG
jgi:hypothetical protein